MIVRLCRIAEVSRRNCLNDTDAVGCTAEEKALVNQWLEYRITRIDTCENDPRSLQSVLKVSSVPFHSKISDYFCTNGHLL